MNPIKLHPKNSNTTFLTLIGSEETARNAGLMIKSLRTFGGRFSDCPLWLFSTTTEQTSSTLTDLPDVQIIPLDIQTSADPYFFRAKVHACAQAEALAGREVRSLVWVNPQCLFVQPPKLFDLLPSFQAAFRTVHIKNIGSPIDRPLDGYWQGVYQAIALEDTKHELESYVDSQQIRPYVNSHLFAIDPGFGLLTKWREIFEQLANDKEFQDSYCADIPHQVFLHQAVLSALLLKFLDWDKIRWLPPEYSYPLHFNTQIPADLRPRSLNDLVCPVYEEAFHYPDTLNGLPIREPLHSWLAGL